MPRPFWQGYLKLSLVTCPVAMTPGITEGERVRFQTINRETGQRVRSQYVDAVTGKVVEDYDQVKGYQKSETEYVMLEDEELESVALESTRTIDVEKFVKPESIPLIYRDKPHYMAPNDEVAEEAFAVIRDAMGAAGVVGISRVVLYRRERAVLLEPSGKGIVAWTLRYGDEVRDPANYMPKASPKLDPNLIKLASDLIAEKTTEWDKSMVEDPVQRELLRIIGSKTPKGSPKTNNQPRAENNVVNIFDALKRSLASELDPKKKEGPGRRGAK